MGVNAPVGAKEYERFCEFIQQETRPLYLWKLQDIATRCDIDMHTAARCFYQRFGLFFTEAKRESQENVIEKLSGCLSQEYLARMLDIPVEDLLVIRFDMERKMARCHV